MKTEKIINKYRLKPGYNYVIDSSTREVIKGEKAEEMIPPTPAERKEDKVDND